MHFLEWIFHLENAFLRMDFFRGKSISWNGPSPWKIHFLKWTFLVVYDRWRTKMNDHFKVFSPAFWPAIILVNDHFRDHFTQKSGHTNFGPPAIILVNVHFSG